MLVSLKMKLIEQGIKQYNLADHIGVSESTISYYISERRAVPDDHKIQIAVYLGCSVGDIFPEPVEARA